MFKSNSGLSDIGLTKHNHVRKFYSQFNNIGLLSVIGKGSREMCTVYLSKVYCLPALSNGCENCLLNDISLHRVTVAWNNCFRSIFNSYWSLGGNRLNFFNIYVQLSQCPI